MSAGRIESVRIRGFRSLADVELSNLQNANVLIGANGSGKSNFIRFFEMMSWMLRSRRLGEFVQRYGGADDQLYGGNSVTPRMEGELALRTDKGRNDYRFALSYAHPDRFIFTEEAYRFSPDRYATDPDWQHVTGGHREGAALLRRGFFALFMGSFARECVSPVAISGGGDIKQASACRRLSGSQPSLVTAPNTFGLLPDRRAPFWTFARRSGTVPWEGRQACDGCDDRIPGTYIRRAPNRRPVHRSPEASPVRSGRCCLRGCQSLPLVQRSPADERERTRTGTAPAGPGVGAQAPARTSRPTQPERGCWSGRGQGHQRCRVLGAARARKPRRNGLRHDAGCGSGLRAARSRRLASARCRAEPAAGALPGRDAPPRDHRDRLAGTTAYALEATVVLDIIHVAAATRRAVLVAGSSKGLSAFGPRSDGRRPAHGDTWLQLRRSSAAAGSRSLDADCRRTWPARCWRAAWTSGGYGSVEPCKLFPAAPLHPPRRPMRRRRLLSRRPKPTFLRARPCRCVRATSNGS